jgi:hypothetical protein
MNRRSNVVMIALAALVAGTAALVYAQEADKVPPAQNPKDQQNQNVTADKPAQDGPKILYDATTLPAPVQRILREMIVTAQRGDIESMRLVLEINELKPMVAAKHVDDPIAYWKKQSVDGSGHDILAAMLDMLDSGFVLTGEGRDSMYVWPYFAQIDLKTLTPAQEVEFFRVVPPKLAAAMQRKGKYTYYRLGVSPSGVWHYFLQ